MIYFINRILPLVNTLFAGKADGSFTSGLPPRSRAMAVCGSTRDAMLLLALFYSIKQLTDAAAGHTILLY
jgi:hypothetical protein